MSQSEPSDAEDVRRSLDGDREAFGRLFDRYARIVRAVVVAVSGEFGAAEDLTQETFLRAYRRLATLKDVNGFRAWIQGIARLVAKEWRRQAVREQWCIDASAGSATSDDSAHHVLQQTEEQRRVMAAVSDLPERERLAVHAYFFCEQNADEATLALGMSRSGYYAALARGIARLRTLLGETGINAAKARSAR